MSVRTSAALRAALLLVLALVCGTFVLPTPAGPLPQLERPRVQQAAPAAAYESVHAGGGEADAPRGSVLHRDRRRAGTAAAGPPGPPPLVTRTAPLTDPPTGRTGGPDTRPRPLAAHDSSALQVFLC
ncbi:MULTISPECIES: hypothetical protein [unclassified Streptomyces]|uniref:hypothetical protein n=1 Tax=unclassified Streptomyces TaxID=2593676 RepID=UPI00165554EC|nr:hypothetical protein [Streptomyces sp. CB02980]MCB8905480.1 hypothetical protein [Streptomyces sp. CB02980]